MKKEAIELTIKKTKEKIIEKAQRYNGLIETEEDLFEHIDRLQKCIKCKMDFYDKYCPDCLKKLKGEK